MERWIGRVALVTGASSGIGASICQALVKSGMQVVGIARNVDKIEEMAGEMKNQKGSLVALHCDLTKDGEILSMFKKVKDQFGGIDVCINNAGISYNHGLLEGTPEEWRHMMDLNVIGVCLLTREAVSSMKERNVDGYVINISSLGGHRLPAGNSGLHFYCATKFALQALTEGVRRELRQLKSSIRVTGISPGIVETEFAPTMLQDRSAADKVYSSIKCLKPEDIADSVLYVLSTPQHVQVHDILIRPTEQVS